MKIEVQDICYAYEDNKTILNNVNLIAQDNQVTAILGHSGSGKSTLLRIIAGLLRPNAGQVLIGSCPVHGCGKNRSVLSANAPLFPWMTVRSNIIFALRQYGKTNAAQITDEIMQRFGIDEFGHKYPHSLSSGMAKQAMLARALAVPSNVLLLDEPLAEIDPKKRLFYHQILSEAAAVRTIILVTHSIDEAITLASIIYLLDKEDHLIRRSWQPTGKDSPDWAESYASLKEEILGHYRQNAGRVL